MAPVFGAFSSEFRMFEVDSPNAGRETEAGRFYVSAGQQSRMGIALVHVLSSVDDYT